MDILTLVVGIAIGLIIGYFVAKSRQKTGGISPEDLAISYISKDRFADLQDRYQNLEREKKEGDQIISSKNAEVATWKQRHESLEQRLQEQKKDLENLQEQFKNEFKVLAQDILEKNSSTFKEQNKEQIANILSPFREKLENFEKKVEETYEKGKHETISLKSEVKMLSEQSARLAKDADNLTRALKGDVKAQGNWGEVVLERILEKSGLNKDQEYFVQQSFTNEEGKRFQPDVLVRLPEDKHVIIDAKVSLIAYERFAASETPEEQARHLRDHIASIRSHIRGLSDKNYQSLYGIQGLDFVLLFIPIEGAFSAAMQSDNSLFQEAFDRNVVLVSTSTLLATLRTISSIWKQEKQTQNSLEIARQGADLYDKFVAFSEDLLKLGKQMEGAKSAYSDAMNKLVDGRGNLIGRAERMRKLGLQTTKSIDNRLLNRAIDEQDSE